MNITLRRHERCNFPDYSPAHHRRQSHTPTPSTTSPASSTSGSSGITEVYPPYGPILFPQHTTYLPANSEGVSYSARSGLLPSATPGISYRHQSVTLWSTLLQALPEPCPGQIVHQEALIAREGRKLGITWMTALLPIPVSSFPDVPKSTRIGSDSPLSRSGRQIHEEESIMVSGMCSPTTLRNLLPQYALDESNNQRLIGGR
jgi:hypothetical protein